MVGGRIYGGREDIWWKGGYMVEGRIYGGREDIWWEGGHRVGLKELYKSSHRVHSWSLCPLQIAQRDIMNSIDREMSGDLRTGFKCIGKRQNFS